MSERRSGLVSCFRTVVAGASPAQLSVAVASGCLLVWSAYLLGFWPGILSDDSLDQWEQLTTLSITSYHPPFHTLTNWMIARVYESPVSVAIVQMLALSTLVGRAVYLALSRGASVALTLACAVAMAVMPAHGLLGITLWKDIPYTCAVVWLTLLVFEVSTSGGAALRRTTSVSLVVALALTALYRHNGVPVAVAVVVLLWIVARAHRRQTTMVAVAALLAVVVTHMVLNSLFRLTPIHPVLRHQAPLHQLAALVNAGTYPDRDDASALERLMPRESWAVAYDCRNVVPLLNRLNSDVFAADVPTYRRLWLEGARRAPGVVARHMECVGGMIWHPGRRPHAFASMGVPANGLGIVTQPVVPYLYKILYRVASFSTRPMLSPLIWGPALHLYVVIVCALIALRRAGVVGALAFTPALLHTAVLIVAIPSAEYRLQYPVVVIGTLAPALLSAILAARGTAGGEVSANVRRSRS